MGIVDFSFLLLSGPGPTLATSQLPISKVVFFLGHAHNSRIPCLSRRREQLNHVNTTHRLPPYYICVVMQSRQPSRLLIQITKFLFQKHNTYFDSIHRLIYCTSIGQQKKSPL